MDVEQYVDRFRNRKRRAISSGVVSSLSAAGAVAYFYLFAKFFVGLDDDLVVEVVDLQFVFAASSCATMGLIFAMFAAWMMCHCVAQFVWSKDRLLVSSGTA